MSEKLEDDSKERVSRRQSEPKTVTGRTQWDALVDIFTTLGTVAPYIAFVGLGLFAFYKFTQLTENKILPTSRRRKLRHLNATRAKSPPPIRFWRRLMKK